MLCILAKSILSLPCFTDNNTEQFNPPSAKILHPWRHLRDTSSKPLAAQIHSSCDMVIRTVYNDWEAQQKKWIWTPSSSTLTLTHGYHTSSRNNTHRSSPFAYCLYNFGYSLTLFLGSHAFSLYYEPVMCNLVKSFARIHADYILWI